jgi:uroporphyrinogen III methyltransferase/synthase
MKSTEKGPSVRQGVKELNDKVRGMVYLIGAGPGNPDLITLRGMECLQRADVIIYDHLVSESLVSLARKDTEAIYVGKQRGRHTMSQEGINSLLIEKAKSGVIVARLKGGDPFIFGRGGEEAAELAKEEIQFEVVPGVTSAIAVPAYAGIPLTHRDHSSTVCFITGHEDTSKEESTINWDALAKCSGTLVFLMGIANLDKIAHTLIANGRPSSSPAAVIVYGTMSNQRTITGTLADIGKKVKQVALRPPGIIVVGDVVNLRDYLSWFESRPLFGKRIVVTRAERQAYDFVRALSELGAQCISLPTIEIVPPASWIQLDKALERISIYDWIVFTSVNGVKCFFERLNRAGKDARHLNGVRIAAIGPKTAEALTTKGIDPDLIPHNFRAEELIEALRQYPLDGKRVLLPRPTGARDYIPKKLKRLGAAVDEIEAYQTAQPDCSRSHVEALSASTIDMVTFTSPSTVSNLLAISKDKPIHEQILQAEIACIGPVTAQKATEMGLRVSVVPGEYTVEALAKAIVKFYNLH